MSTMISISNAITGSSSGSTITPIPTPGGPGEYVIVKMFANLLGNTYPEFLIQSGDAYVWVQFNGGTIDSLGQYGQTAPNGPYLNFGNFTTLMIWFQFPLGSTNGDVVVVANDINYFGDQVDLYRTDIVRADARTWLTFDVVRLSPPATNIEYVFNIGSLPQYSANKLYGVRFTSQGATMYIPNGLDLSAVSSQNLESLLFYGYNAGDNIVCPSYVIPPDLYPTFSAEVSLASGSLNSLLIGLDNSGVDGNLFNRSFYSIGSGNPSGAGATARTNLINKDWSIAITPTPPPASTSRIVTDNAPFSTLITEDGLDEIWTE